MREKRDTHMPRAHEEQLARIVEMLPNGIVIVDRDGHLTFANAAAERILGLTRHGIAECTHNDPRWKITAADGKPFPEDSLPFVQIMRTGESVRGVEHAIEHSDGNRVVLSIDAAPLHGAVGGFADMVASLTDITERKRTEAALREAERKYRAIFENAVEGIFQSTVEGRFLTANPALARMLGYTSPEEMITSITDIGHQLYVDSARRDEFMRLIQEQGRVSDVRTLLPSAPPSPRECAPTGTRTGSCLA
jgi:PAS domain S-box-containing protein